MKKLLALVMALVMTLGLATVAANASFPDAADVELEEAVEVMAAVGVFQGDEKGNFSPKANLTRDAAAKLIAYLDLGEKAAEALPAVQVFSDVPASNWAAKYIAYCYNAGYIAGAGDNKFLPGNALTGYAFGKMILCVLGYDAAIEGFTGNTWSINVAKFMTKLELNDGVDGSASAVLTREQAAQYCLNALKQNMVEYEDKGTTVSINGATIATGAKAAKDQLATLNAKYQTIDATTDAGKDIIQLGEKLYGTKIRLVKGDTDDMGRPSNKWYYNEDSKALNGAVADKYLAVAAPASADKVFVNNSDLKWKTDMDTTVKQASWFDDNAVTIGTVTINGDASTAAALYALKDNEGLVVEAYEDDTTAKKYNLVAYEYTVFEITDVDTDVKDADKKDGVNAYVEIDGTTYNDKDIPGFDAASYVKDAYVAVVVNGAGEIVDSFIPETVTGNVGSVKTGNNGYATIGGTKYYLADEAIAAGDLKDTVAASASDEFELYLDANDVVIGVKLVEGEAETIDDVYYVDNIYKDDEKIAGGTETTYYAQLVNIGDGTVSQTKLESKDKANPANDYVTDKANYERKLVTISDKKWTNGGDTYKANNDKFDLSVWTPTKDWIVKTDVAAKLTSPATKLAKDTTRITFDGTTYRLNADTKYILLKGTQNKLKVNLYTGGVSYTLADLNTAYLIDALNSSGNDTKVVSYMILLGTQEKTGTTFSSDVVFVKSASSEKGDGFRNQTLYLADGTKETWTVDETSYDLAKGFYAYDTNSDGYYELDDNDVDVITVNNTVWDDEAGVVIDATIAKDALYDNLLTISLGGKKLEDIKVGSAAFVDAHDKSADGQYDKAVSSLAKLCDLVDNNKVQNVQLSLNISEKGAVTIVLTSVEPV